MKTTSTFSILFWLNSARMKNEKGLIYARITVNGVRAVISLKRKIVISDWDPIKNRARGTKQEARLLNRYLDQVYSGLFESYQDLRMENKLITARAVKSRYLGEDQQHQSLLTLVEYHNTQMTETLRWGTLKNYFTTQRYIKEFIESQFKTSDIYLHQLSYKFIIDFERFLRKYVPKTHHKRMGNNTVMKHIERLRKIISLGHRIEWIDKDPFIQYKAKYDKVERGFLTKLELQRIEDWEFKTDRLQVVKDLFVFSCYTGLSYIDMMMLTKLNLVRGMDGEYWINTIRQKTSTTVKIPILEKAAKLLFKYKKHPRALENGTLFPVISNQKMNAYLKEIAEICEIEKNMTFHMARHTFATTVTLTNGVPIETVSKLLGHSKITTTQIYAKIIERKVGDDMKKLSDYFAEEEKRNEDKETGS
ncbi:MAG: site-specific integrase [Flavobacteriaceae bacterium]|nr:site-specific integrase [Flavobacteriaceae bacterium]